MRFSEIHAVVQERKDDNHFIVNTIEKRDLRHNDATAGIGKSFGGWVGIREFFDDRNGLAQLFQKTVSRTD